MNTSPELEDQLKRSLDRLTDGARLRDGVAPLIRRRTRRVQRTRYAAVAGVAAVAAAATLTVSSGGTAAPQPTQAYVISHVTSALAAPARADDVIHTVTTWPRFAEVVQGWYAQDAARVVQPRLTYGWHRSGTKYVIEYVNDRTRTWQQSPISDLPTFLPPISETGFGESLAGCHLPNDSSYLKSNWRSYIRDVLGCGAFKVTGHTRINGTAVIVLARSTRLGEGSHGVTVVRVLEVNAATYLPVRLDFSTQMGSGRIFSLQTDFQWLPPTATNRAYLAISIPPGFHHTRATATNP
jgi:hypothetical protein